MSWPGSQLAQWAGALAVFGMIGAGGFWLTRHFIALRRTVLAGHNWTIHHPLVEVTLIIIAAIGFLMSQTVGFIK